MNELKGGKNPFFNKRLKVVISCTQQAFLCVFNVKTVVIVVHSCPFTACLFSGILSQSRMTLLI